MKPTLGRIVHYVIAGQDFTSADHQLGHGAPVASTLEHVVGDERHRLGMVQPQPARLPATGEVGRIGDQQPVGFMR